MRILILVLFVIGLAGCQNYQKQLPQTNKSEFKVKKIPPSPQQKGGDPEKGFEYLAYGNYLGTGIPYEYVKNKPPFKIKQDTVLNRTGINATIPHRATVFEAENGLQVMNGNCFACHAGEVNGQIIPGLGDSFSDFTHSMGPFSKVVSTGVRWKFGRESDEFETYEEFGQYFREIPPYIQTKNKGTNPAARLAEAIVKHRDPVDLSYLEEPAYEMPAYTLATDVPPFWHVKKKNALYYTAVGRGDFTKLLFQASFLGIPDTLTARRAVNNFKHVIAWMETLEPPPFPKEIDYQIAEKGKVIFNDHCSDCHGTYGQQWTYPNKVVSLDVVKTDPYYASYATQAHIVDWYNDSWFATSYPESALVPEAGYIAPPLDGIWATAPYLHNGSVPTLYHLIHPDERPEKWKRKNDSRDYDYNKVGWNFKAKEIKLLNGWTYNTQLPGYGNQGHSFGSDLSEKEKDALIEYLKTL